MIINATDITTMTTAKPKVTPIISATLLFSIEVCSAFRTSASAVNSAEFFSLGVDAVVVCLNSLSSGLMPENAKYSSKQLEVQSSSVLKLCLRDYNRICIPNHLKQFTWGMSRLLASNLTECNQAAVADCLPDYKTTEILNSSHQVSS